MLVDLLFLHLFRYQIIIILITRLYSEQVTGHGGIESIFLMAIDQIIKLNNFSAIKRPIALKS